MPFFVLGIFYILNTSCLSMGNKYTPVQFGSCFFVPHKMLLSNLKTSLAVKRRISFVLLLGGNIICTENML